MFGRHKRQTGERMKELARCDAYEKQQSESAAITKQAYELRHITSPTERRKAALDLLTKTQTEIATLLRSAENKGYVFHNLSDLGLRQTPGDFATHIGEELANIARSNVCHPQSAWAALSEQFPEVIFTIDWFDAAALIAANLREAMLKGIIDGLDLSANSYHT